MSILLKRPYLFKPPVLRRPSSLFEGCLGLWGLFHDDDKLNLVTGANDGTSAQTSFLRPSKFGLCLPADQVNSGFYEQTLRGVGNFYSAPADWTDIAFVRARDFSNAENEFNENFVLGHQYGCCRFAGLKFPTAPTVGRMRYEIDATGFGSNVTSGLDNEEANWDYGIIAGGSDVTETWIYFRSCPFGTGTKFISQKSGNEWSGSTGGEAVSVGHRPRVGHPVAGGIDIYWAAHFNRVLSFFELESLARNPFQWWDRRVWVPVEAGPPGPIELNINDLRHARPVDQVDVTEVITIVPIDINALRHNRRVDSLILGISVDLFVASMRHGRAVDQVALEVSVDLTIDSLRHGRVVDLVAVQELVGVLIDIADQHHRRPVDSLLLDVDQPILIDALRHGRPIDTAGVQPLLGDQTGIGATASNWILDAGQPLNNASSVDFDYHVLEGIFDSDQSVLGVDGSRVTGSAGMRQLTALTLGANVDGQERVHGEIAELRIYAGALSQADRDRILQELTVKWITG